MWVIIAILSAFSWASSDAFAKFAFKKEDTTEFFLIWVRYLVALPFLLPLIFFTKFPHLTSRFFFLHLFWIPLETTAIFLYVRAIKISEISLSLPFLSLTPFFLIFTGYIFLGEKASSLAIWGIILIVLGSYIMKISEIRTSPFAPFKALFRDKGVPLIFIVAFIYSLTSIAGKMLIKLSNPWFFSVYYTIVMSFILSPFGLREKGHSRVTGRVLASGIFYGLMILTHMLAINMAYVSYMIAIKRLSGVFSVFYGAVLFKEKGIKERLPGSFLMVIGAFLISIA